MNALLFAVSLITANYQVPLPPGRADLAPYASFEIPSVQESVSGNQISFSYDLPADLVGPGAQPVTLSGTIEPGQPLTLEGDHAQATCSVAPAESGDGQNAVCQVQYTDLAGWAADPSQVQQYLAQTIRDPAELQARLAVARLFGSDPVGVLVYRL